MSLTREPALGARVPQAELYVYFVALTGGPYQQVKLILAFITKRREKSMCSNCNEKEKYYITTARLPTHPANRISEIRMSLCLRTQSQDTKEARATMSISRPEQMNMDRRSS